jgi:saccharopine dehydrogenase (NAD+, L-lysine-forming)
MAVIIGMQRETKSKWERRAPLTPDHVRQLTAQGVQVLVQPSPVRIFPDAGYREAGARVQDDLSPCSAIFAVKEIPIANLLPGKTYVFFSHTIKGQAYNMPLLQKLLDLGCRLVDYERIADEQGRRLVFFGRHAGLAGMIDSLHVLGQRWAADGVETPLAAVKLAFQYEDLSQAMADIAKAGQHIAEQGLPNGVAPLIIGMAGDGNVSKGAQAILEALPIEKLTSEALLQVDIKSLSSKQVYQVVFQEADMVRPMDPGQSFDLKDYYARPEKYVGRFGDYLDRLSVLINGIYWESRYPRLITKADAARLWAGDRPHLAVIGDLGCDIGGPVEFTVKATGQENPTFVYEPATDSVRDGVAGNGPVVLAVDNLPCELPVDASQSFGDALLPFVAAIGAGDPTVALAAADLPYAVRRAVITDNGTLTPDYAYLAEHLKAGASR